MHDPKSHTEVQIEQKRKIILIFPSFDLVDVFCSVLKPHPTKAIELTSALFNRILTSVDVSFQGKLNVIDV